MAKLTADRYAVIGRPIGHSRSPAIHRAFAAQTGQDIEYTAIEGTEGGFAADADALRRRGGRGLNITAPFKLDAHAYATALQDDAKLAGAVNCLKFDGNTATGANFDGVGLVRDIESNLGVPIKGARVLMLGAGGAVRGALLPFLSRAPAELVLANRTEARARALVAEFAGHGGGRLSAETSRGPPPGSPSRPFDIVVNATSSLTAGAPPMAPPGAFGPRCLAYDLTYGKGLTPFLRWAREAGAVRLADGVGMLVEQAAEAFAWWRGVRPATAPVIRAMTVPLT